MSVEIEVSRGAGEAEGLNGGESSIALPIMLDAIDTLSSMDTSEGKGNWSSPLSPSNGGEEEENGWDLCQGRMQPTLGIKRKRGKSQIKKEKGTELYTRRRKGRMERAGRPSC